MRFGLQLYSVREPAKKDLQGTLKKVREIGFEYVQWSGMPDLPANEIRNALDNAGLKAISAHISIEEFEKNFDEQVQFWQTVGVTDLAPGGMMSDCRANSEVWLKGCARLDALGARLRLKNLRLSYHNHDWELQPFPNQSVSKLDMLLQSTCADNLYAEFDLAWIYVGGSNPANWLKKYPKRCPVIHVKDVRIEKKAIGKKHVIVPLGKGDLNWDEILPSAKTAQVEWYFYEQDSFQGDIFEEVSESYNFLKKRLSS
ncbi:MAG TPA: sugar phosphate isomerase/epimerase [Candidatus Hydrogenedens sp.]|nr:sugar phosphate isomerase/epimerase [Candidatus Hydrogenedens sp.]HOL20415.1 sugar phosphate isomerase/epimerase [Candidatus Hydrogenedens sp.]HPP59714.1 sugar phosphate isomerase/epimerase [Candidatus Hydrogenedens sp.]